MRSLVFAALVALCGCSTYVEALGPEHAPLERVEVSALRVHDPEMVITAGHVVYVHDEASWALHWPPGSLLRTALLKHERVHAERELAEGWRWYLLYDLFPASRWEEERAGWREELRFYVQAGMTIDADRVAAVLSGPAYALFGTPMVTFETARAWVQSVVASAGQ